MPEGPDVLYNTLLLNDDLKNCEIVNIISGGKKIITMPNDFNGKIIKIDCKGKILWFETVSHNFVHVHFGMRGIFQFVEPTNPNTISYTFTIKCDEKKHFKEKSSNDNKKNDNNKNDDNIVDNNNTVDNELFSKYIINNQLLETNHFKLFLKDTDYRKLAKVEILTEEEHNNIINELGISIFSPDFTLVNFKALINSKKTLLTPFLMNPHIISGIGNYIRNEVFYLTDLLPIKIKTNQLTDSQIHKLYHDILFVSYSVLMTHFRNHNDLKSIGVSMTNPVFTNLPNNIEVPYEYKIYERKITKNGEVVEEIKVNGRNTFCVKSQCN